MTFDFDKQIDNLKAGFSLAWEHLNAGFNLVSSAAVENAKLLARDLSERQRIASRALKTAAE